YDVPTILGHGVSLRAFHDSDRPRIREAAAEARMQHWFAGLPTPYTAEDARDFLEDRHEQLATGSGLSWAVADPGTDVLLGNVSLFAVRPGRDAEVGFWAHPEARGRGLTTEAVRLAVRHAFVPEDDGGLGLRRLRATVADGNVASVQVVETTGFTSVGREREGARLGDGTPVDLLCYDLLEPEWSGVARDR
ncbi:MAG: GNAT family N-acetyltransferase, partial [Actinomycetes bacterium]